MTSPAFRFDDEATRKRAGRISRMFDQIAPTYDVLNHLLSANIDQAWRRTTVRALGLTGVEHCLDACTGTGDLALALVAGGAKDVVGSDFAPRMVARARGKADANERARTRTRFLVADTDEAAVPGRRVRRRDRRLRRAQPRGSRRRPRRSLPRAEARRAPRDPRVQPSARTRSSAGSTTSTS